MGKKKGKDKKGKGAEKTAQKTDRKAERKQKKELEKKGEDDIEKLIADFQAQDRKQAEVTEVRCPAPSPRCNMSLTAHPEKDELILFGGEYFNGKNTYLYNDLYFYSLKSKEWSQVKTPNMPPPRCAHQAVCLPQDGVQLWVFGGEFASPTQSQFYHYKDLWVYNMRDKLWTKINAPGGPTSRSGHRMVACRRFLFVFGGFHDNIRDYKYYNDLHAFSLDTYTWTKLDISGSPPAPRSACVMAVSEDSNKVLVYGGYSKERIKKEVDKGKTHTDMYMLSVDAHSKKEAAPLKWKWQSVKQSGYRPSARCGCSLIVTPGNRALVFGGVFDKEEDEEDVTGEFYNDLYSLELDRGRWHQINMRGAKQKKKRRRKKGDGDGDDMGDEADDADSDAASEQEEEEEDMEQDDNIRTDDDVKENPEVGNPSDVLHKGDTETEMMEVEDAQNVPEQSNVFSVTVAGGQSSQATTEASTEAGDHLESRKPVVPGPRMNALLAVKHGVLYLYGGVYEVGDKQYTLSDMYSLDLHRLDTWSTLIECNMDLQDWQESEESSEEEEEEEGLAAEAEGMDHHGDESDEDEDDDDDDDDDDEDDEETPSVEADQSLDDYFSENHLHWITKATTLAEQEGLQVTAKQIKKAAFKIAKESYTEQTS